MTERQKELVKKLRYELLRACYPTIYIVDNETLEAVEKNLEEHLESLGLDPILQCGKYGLFFKGVQLVLEGR